MTQYLKGILVALIVGVTIISLPLYAQNVPLLNDVNFKDFISLDDQKKEMQTSDSEDYICTVFKADKKLFLKNKAFKIKRQLADTCFIISFENKTTTTNTYQRFIRIKKANSLWKLSPLLLNKIKEQSTLFPLNILVSIDTSWQGYQNLFKDFTLNKTTVKNIFTGTIKNYTALNNIIKNRSVIFISALAVHPKEEQQINDLDLSVNKINTVHSEMPFLDGAGITISIKENLPDTTDIDFASRYVYNPVAAINYSSHASTMATMLAGAGNSYYLGKGVATAAQISSADFKNLLPDATANYHQFNITVQNHSYGVGVENFYGADAAAYDASTLENDSLLFVFSAGNAGNLSATSGMYSGIKNQANITGSFKMAKNIITVGAVDSFGIAALASSRGPAFDGRVAPCIVAYGEDGTSGAAALVSGTAAVLQQSFKTLHNKQLPSSALIKAILINSSDVVENTPLSFTTGYGNLNALKAIQTVLNSAYFEGTSTNGSVKIFTLNIPANIAKAKFTLAWNDVPAQPNTNIALINDLDLELKFPTNNNSWLPWVKNSSANADSLAALPLRKRDSLNNVEQITIDNPVEGKYQLLIKGFNIPSGIQNFDVAYQFDSINNFKFCSPAAADNIFPGTVNIIRWESTFKTDSARLFYSINNGTSWQTIDTLIKLNKKYYYWNAPDTNTLAMLRMQIGSTSFISTAFSISNKLNLKTGFNCPDSVLLYWNKLPGISTYKIYSLQGNYLQPGMELKDTFFVFAKKDIPYKQFAVAPVFNGHEGLKSYTINFTQQGVDCYISKFTGDLKPDTTANLQLQLGTNFFIKKIIFEKLKQGIYNPLKIIDIINGSQYITTDQFLQNGVNSYRAHLILKDGRDIFSSTTSVFYFKNSTVSIFPNPVVQNSYATIQLKDLDNQIITITNILGQTVFKKQAAGNSQLVLFNFLRGLYIITITDPEKLEKRYFKIVII